MQADVGEAAIVDGGERLRHAVDERLDADEAGRRMLLRLGDEMLAAAEAAFQSDVAGALEQRAQIGRRRAIKIERELRQQRVEQRRLPRFERMALAPAEKRALAVTVVHLSHARACHRKSGLPDLRTL